MNSRLVQEALEGVNLTLPYELEYASASAHYHAMHLTYLFSEIQSLADNGYYPYPVELIETYDDSTVVAFDETGAMVKYVLHGDEDMNGDGSRRLYTWIDVYLISPSGSWVQMREPEV